MQKLYLKEWIFLSSYSFRYTQYFFASTVNKLFEIISFLSTGYLNILCSITGGIKRERKAVLYPVGSYLTALISSFFSMARL